MDDLRIVIRNGPDGSVATVMHGDVELGTAAIANDPNGVELAIPLELLAAPALAANLKAISDKAIRAKVEADLWAWADKNCPTAMWVDVQYGTEYNDEGGYYETVAITFLDADGCDIAEDDDLYDAIQDLPYELDQEPSSDWFPAGAHRRPDKESQQ